MVSVISEQFALPTETQHVANCFCLIAAWFCLQRVVLNVLPGIDRTAAKLHDNFIVFMYSEPDKLFFYDTE